MRCRKHSFVSIESMQREVPRHYFTLRKDSFALVKDMRNARKQWILRRVGRGQHRLGLALEACGSMPLLHHVNPPPSPPLHGYIAHLHALHICHRTMAGVRFLEKKLSMGESWTPVRLIQGGKSGRLVEVFATSMVHVNLETTGRTCSPCNHVQRRRGGRRSRLGDLGECPRWPSTLDLSWSS